MIVFLWLRLMPGWPVTRRNAPSIASLTTICGVRSASGRLPIPARARCRAIATDVRTIGDAARAHDVAAPDLAGLRDQVIARRAAGTRVILSAPQYPAHDPAERIAVTDATHTRDGGAWRRLAAAALVGAVAGAGGVGGLWHSLHHGESALPGVAPAAMGTALDMTYGAACQTADPAGGAGDPDGAAGEGTALRRLLANEGFAALVPFVGCPAQIVVAPPVRDFDASRVRPMTITYQARTVVDTLPIESDERTFAIARVTLRGQAAWNITGYTNRYPLVTKQTDSLYLSAADLRPLRQISFGSHGARRLRIDLAGDSGILHSSTAIASDTARTRRRSTARWHWCISPARRSVPHRSKRSCLHSICATGGPAPSISWLPNASSAH